MIIGAIATSVDGRYGGPDRELDWQSFDDEFKAYSNELVERADALLLGRVTFEEMRAYWPTVEGRQFDPAVARRMNALPKHVVSSQPVDGWENARPIALADVPRLTGTVMLLGSGTLLRHLAAQRQVDRLELLLNPIALGDGLPLFEGLGGRLALALRDVRRFGSGILLLTYAPR